MPRLGLVKSCEASLPSGRALTPMDATQVSVIAHVLLGASQILEHRMETETGRAYPGDEAVVDAYAREILALVTT
jgi:hypothetical protein